MNKPISNHVLPSVSDPWQSEGIFLQYHLHLTSLILAQVERSDVAEDIASACLVDLWEASLSSNSFFSINSFLQSRLAERILDAYSNSALQVSVERQYLTMYEADIRKEDAVSGLLNRITLLLPLLEPQEAQLIRLLIEEGASLEQAADRLQFPVSKAKRLYKHAIFRMQKELGLLKKYS